VTFREYDSDDFPDVYVFIRQAIAAIWRSKLIVACFVVGGGIGGFAYVMLVEPIYRVEIVMSPNNAEDEMRLSPILSGIASLGGISVDGSGEAIALATLQSRSLVGELIDDLNLLPTLFASEWDESNGKWKDEDASNWPDTRMGTRLFLDVVLDIEENVATGLVTLAVEWRDPEAAAMWATELVERTNERLRSRDLEGSSARLEFLNEELESISLVEVRQAISRLIEGELQRVMVAQAEQDYAFKVIDPAIVPREPVSPRKAMIVGVAIILGFLLGSFAVVASSVGFRQLLGERAA
jgi:uncharacterized protein involved in exopolysaccharide biosynthesis